MNEANLRHPRSQTPVQFRVRTGANHSLELQRSSHFHAHFMPTKPADPWAMLPRAGVGHLAGAAQCSTARRDRAAALHAGGVVPQRGAPGAARHAARGQPGGGAAGCSAFLIVGTAEPASVLASLLLRHLLLSEAEAACVAI